MHSSRMRTARLLPVSPSMHCSRECTTWGGYLVQGGVPAQREGIPAQREGIPAQGGTGVYLVWGVYLLLGGVPALGGTYPGTPPPPVNRMTNRCKNMTLPQTSFAGGNYLLFLSHLAELLVTKNPNVI